MTGDGHKTETPLSNNAGRQTQRDDNAFFSQNTELCTKLHISIAQIAMGMAEILIQLTGFYFRWIYGQGILIHFKDLDLNVSKHTCNMDIWLEEQNSIMHVI